MSPKLNARDLEILLELRAACDQYISFGRKGWVQPLDVGGSSRSDHSYRLSKLARTPYAEEKQRMPDHGSRGSKSYRITPAGRDLLAAPLPAGPSSKEGQ